MSTNNKIVLVAHCIDTEGPLYEPIQATFQRLYTAFGIKDLPPTQETLQKLRLKEIPLDGKEEEV